MHDMHIGMHIRTDSKLIGSNVKPTCAYQAHRSEARHAREGARATARTQETIATDAPDLTDSRTTCQVSPDRTDGRSEDSWNSTEVERLLKGRAPAVFRLLQLMSILVPSCGMFSQVMIHVAEGYDVGTHVCKAGMAMQGFRRGFQCAELVLALRTVTEKSGKGESDTHTPRLRYT